MENFMKEIKIASKLSLGILLTLVFFTTVFSGTVFANSYQLPCPFSSETNRTIVNFNTEFVWGKTTTEIVKNVNLSAGTYKVSLQSFDGYDARNEVSQPNESYFVEFRNGSTLVATSDKTPDLRDNVANASYAGIVNSDLILSQAVTSVKARHSNFSTLMETANSVTAGCVAFDLITPTPVYPACGSASDVARATKPTSNLCSKGTVGSSSGTGVNDGVLSWFWGCVGSDTGWADDTAWCFAPKINDDGTLNGSCSVNPSSVNVGGSLNWSASASGGAGSYTYSWTGTDSFSGTGSSLSKVYSLAGTKTGTVTITSGNQSIMRTCSAVVTSQINNNLNVSCSASPSRIDVDEDVVWRANVSGGDGDYDYDWDGTDNLRGYTRNVTWSYDDDGTKTATVTVESDGQTASASCTVRVDEEDDDDDDDLSVSCYASPTSVQTGSRMNWYVRVSGGDGDYDYDWEGDDGLNSSSRSPSMTYYNAGRKSAEVTVRDSDGNRDIDTCYVNVNSVLAFTQTYQPVAPEAIYLNQVPYTGVADNYKLAFFVGILALFSAWISYIVISYKKNVGEIN
jgi:hypothetical protein